MGTPDRYRHITWIRSLLLCSYKGNILSFRLVGVYESWQDSPLQGKHCGIYLPPNCPVYFHVVSFMFSGENEAQRLNTSPSFSLAISFRCRICMRVYLAFCQIKVFLTSAHFAFFICLHIKEMLGGLLQVVIKI